MLRGQEVENEEEIGIEHVIQSPNQIKGVAHHPVASHDARDNKNKMDHTKHGKAQISREWQNHGVAMDENRIKFEGMIKHTRASPETKLTSKTTIMLARSRVPLYIVIEEEIGIDKK